MDAAVAFPVTPKAVKATPLKLRRGMRAEQAFERILGNCIEQIIANEEGVIRCHDVESLHQLRVGLRRLRAALSMFDPWLRLPESLAMELDWLAGELGPARDLDVLLEQTLPGAEGVLPEMHSLPEVSRLVRADVHAMHERAAAALVSPRYRHLMVALERWRERHAWRDMQSKARQARLDMKVGEVAAAILAHDHRRMEKRARKLRRGGAAARHRLRIAAKRTRYAAEFFASLFPQRRVRPYVDALSNLQDELGAMNDAIVADCLLAALAIEHAQCAPDVGFVRGFLAGRTGHGIARVEKLWKRFKPMRPPH